MSTSPKEPIRLAPTNQPGANLYNSYHFLAQLSGLYAQAAQNDPDQVAAGVWRELSDKAIGDLGELYLAWEIELATQRAGGNAVINVRLGQSVSRACFRLNIIVERLSIWTPMMRWVRIMQLGERRWQRFLVAFAEDSKVAAGKLGELRQGSLNRLSRLTGLNECYRKDEERAAAGFSIMEQDEFFRKKTGT